MIAAVCHRNVCDKPLTCVQYGHISSLGTGTIVSNALSNLHQAINRRDVCNGHCRKCLTLSPGNRGMPKHKKEVVDDGDSSDEADHPPSGGHGSRGGDNKLAVRRAKNRWVMMQALVVQQQVCISCQASAHVVANCILLIAMHLSSGQPNRAVALQAIAHALLGLKVNLLWTAEQIQWSFG